jgi:endogenous inhibitor of DNA gyrase (YacG/DUF329 family)
MKIPRSAHKDIIDAYTVDLWPMGEIAEVLHVSRSAVWKILKKHGVDTSKHKITVSCTTCGANIDRTRKRVRKQTNHFCSQDCYSAFLGAGKSSYASGGNSSRIARAIVSQWFDLKPEHVVHHEDCNRFNNLKSNLRVFANQGDHIRYHHQERDKYANGITNRKPWSQDNLCPYIPAKPIWDGSAAS